MISSSSTVGSRAAELREALGESARGMDALAGVRNRWGRTPGPRRARPRARAPQRGRSQESGARQPGARAGGARGPAGRGPARETRAWSACTTPRKRRDSHAATWAATGARHGAWAVHGLAAAWLARGLQGAWRRGLHGHDSAPPQPAHHEPEAHGEHDVGPRQARPHRDHQPSRTSARVEIAARPSSRIASRMAMASLSRPSASRAAAARSQPATSDRAGGDHRAAGRGGAGGGGVCTITGGGGGGEG